MAIGTDVIISDDFNVANGPLNSTTWPVVIGDIGIVNNMAQPTVAAVSSVRLAMFNMSNSASANYGIRFTCGDTGVGVMRGALLRSDDAGLNAYTVMIQSETTYSFRYIWGGANVTLFGPSSDNVVTGDLAAELTAEVETVAGQPVIRLRTANGGGKLIQEFTVTEPLHQLLSMGRGGMAMLNNNAISNGYGSINQAAVVGTATAPAVFGFTIENIFNPKTQTLVADATGVRVVIRNAIGGTELSDVSDGVITGGTLSYVYGADTDVIQVELYWTESGEQRFITVSRTVGPLG